MAYFAHIDHYAARLRDRVSYLEEENRQLRDTLKPPICFPDAWQLTPQQAAFLAALHACRSGVLSRERLAMALWGGRVRTPDAKIIDVMICHIRRKLLAANTGVEIETKWGVGWRLTPDSVRRLDAVAKNCGPRFDSARRAA